MQTTTTTMTRPAKQGILTNEQLRRIAPAIFAKSCDPEVTDEYQFVPTTSIINRLADRGMYPVQAEQCMLTQKNPIWGFHTVRFQAKDPQFIRGMADELIPQAVVENSHDRSRRFMIMAGFFRLICTNGMIAPITGPDGKQLATQGRSLHLVSLNLDAMIDRAFESLDESIKLIKGMTKEMLNTQERVDFVMDALRHVYGKDYAKGLNPVSWLQPRRKEDAANDLWHVFNRVQENFVKGGVKLETGRLTHPLGSGPHSGAMVRSRFNQFLWTRAMQFMN